MGQALYRKYRSKNLAEVVGQEPITKALDRALSSGHISHAYLFTGPRGVGKTSIARILAHEVNKLPYDETTTHLDIIEIDAASNRRIDEIRDLRNKVHIAPSAAPYKVYIVDEVHMLTKEAFNALLKTLEEPPAHAIFILATTEVHKLPETIISRTQHYAFKPVAQTQVVAHLAHIASQEKVAIDADALELIADHGQGSFRDSISLLDQVRNYGDTISRSDVEAVLGVAPETAVADILNAIAAHQAPTVVTVLQDIRHQGVDAAALAKQLGSQLRRTLLAQTSVLPANTSIALQKDLLAIPTAQEPFIALELCLLTYAFDQSQPAVQQPVAIVTTAPLKPSKTQPTSVAQSPVAKPVQPPTPAPAPPKALEPTTENPQSEEPTADVESLASGSFTIEQWPDVLTHIKQTYNTMYGVLRMADASFTNNELTLSFKFAFHQKRLNDPKNKAIIIDAIKQLSGGNVGVICIVGEDSDQAQPAQPTQPADLGAISNIFGGAEVLES